MFIPDGQRPHEVMFLFISPVFAYDMLFGPARLALSVAHVPYAEVLAFALVLVVSGIIGLVGCALRTRAAWWDVGIRLEGGALVFGAGGLLLFTYVIGDVSHWQGSSYKFLGAWTAANVWRSVQCVRAIRASKGA